MFDPAPLLKQKGRKHEQADVIDSVILIAMVTGTAVPTRAQAAYGVRADVPFDFVVGDKTIQAGRIVADGVSADSQGALSIRNLTHGEIALRAGRRMSGADRTARGKLVFNKYGDRYFLAQIWTPGFEACEVMKSKEERSLERDMRLVKNFKPARVVVAASIE